MATSSALIFMMAVQVAASYRSSGKEKVGGSNEQFINSGGHVVRAKHLHLEESSLQNGSSHGHVSQDELRVLYNKAIKTQPGSFQSFVKKRPVGFIPINSMDEYEALPELLIWSVGAIDSTEYGGGGWLKQGVKKDIEEKLEKSCEGKNYKTGFIMQYKSKDRDDGGIDWFLSAPDFYAPDCTALEAYRFDMSPDEHRLFSNEEDGLKPALENLFNPEGKNGEDLKYFTGAEKEMGVDFAHKAKIYSEYLSKNLIPTVKVLPQPYIQGSKMLGDWSVAKEFRVSGRRVDGRDTMVQTSPPGTDSWYTMASENVYIANPDESGAPIMYVKADLEECIQKGLCKKNYQDDCVTPKEATPEEEFNLANGTFPVGVNESSQLVWG